VREIHNVRVVELDGRRHLSLHVKLPAELSLREAHAAADETEQAIRVEAPEIDTVHVHLEPLSPPSAGSPATEEERLRYEPALLAIGREVTGQDAADVLLHHEARGLVASLTVYLPAADTLAEAHRVAGRVEEAIRSECPDLVEVVVHTEPAG
jgi:divalent metal cation (Fe/Co/Zn/Cd) transporter